jgi:carbamate kinase
VARSPRPLEIVEAPLVLRLVREGVVVIAAGGGGPPVYRDAVLGLEGVDGVVDKDLVAAMLARQLGAEVLMILTDVDAVYADWGTPAQRPLRRLALAEAEALLRREAFPAGSMRPKVEAAAGFVRGGGARAVIARLSDGPAALRGETGTTIARDT